MTGIITAGEQEGSVELKIDRRFLELFSEHLYSSPNKAFEELVSNSWDAGASSVFISFPDDLLSKTACIWVLDDGVSMDANGLQDLWHIGSSTKRTTRHRGRKNPIGKFGIGKLATYILAEQITYVCRAADGIIRIVTLDYTNLGDPAEHIEMQDRELPLRVIDQASLDEELRSIPGGLELTRLVSDFSNRENPVGNQAAPENALTCDLAPGTWTLVVLTGLKPKATEIEKGRLRYMLRASLPIGTIFKIFIGGEPLEPKKSAIPVIKQWSIGAILQETATIQEFGPEPVTEFDIKIEGDVVVAPGLGEISGVVRLYDDSIAGGKSGELGDSEGFYVDVLGRVVNLGDPMFGLHNLKHGVLTRFRAEVRCDGLDRGIKVDRERLVDTEDLRRFRGILMAVFNKARRYWESTQEDVTTREIVSILEDNWQDRPTEPFNRFIEEAFEAQPYVNSILRITGDKNQAYQVWRERVKQSPKEVIGQVELSGAFRPEDPLSVYDLAERRLLVNSNHPFVRRATSNETPAEVLRVLALANLLADSYLLDLGLSPSAIDDYVQYRDRMLRIVNRAKRKDLVALVELLEHAGSYEKGLERVLHESLAMLGFNVKELGQPGEPEGIATAIMSTDSESKSRDYSLTYDAKSSKDVVDTGNVGVAGLARHRDRYRADYVLVVGPAFRSGALESECAANRVTPMTCNDLAKLLRLTATYGRIPLDRLVSLFSCYSPNRVRGLGHET